MDINQFPLLNNIESPTDLRRLPEAELVALAKEIRHFMVDTLDGCGGHFGSNLGTVELTIALHYVFNTPYDRLIWDVGHQAYPHKILTGRKQRLATVRQTDGLAPFPKRGESDFDPISVGHSSTSIGIALGMAAAAKLDNIRRQHVAVIGDGALTAGMAFEALNHAGAMHSDMLVILNDNEMSISHNVGALSNYLARILSGRAYSSMREGSKRILKNVPPMWDLVKRTEQHMKGMLAPGTIFEELGFYYVGPIDGHDIPTLLATLRNLEHKEGPKLLHVVTQKGKGYAKAEADPVKYHAVKPGFNSGTSTATTKQAPTYSNIFGQWLCDMAEQDPRLVAITPAMKEGSGMVQFAKQHPNRFFDVGIAEQHSVTFAAGLAAEDKKPVVAIYSTFLQRAYDQFIHDVALQDLPVLFAIDRAGLVGGDGTTHNGSFDLSFLRCIPNLVLMAPADENECRQMLYTGYHYDGPCAVRYPRGTGPGSHVETKMAQLALGKGEIRRQGQSIAILAFGSMVNTAMTVGEKIDATVINMRFIKPIDQALVTQIAASHDLLVTIEENVIAGGAGSAVAEVLAAHQLQNALLQLGLPDNFVHHGDGKELLTRNGLDAKGIMDSIEGFSLAAKADLSN